MNLEKMDRNQLKWLLDSNMHTLRSIEIGMKNWRNAMLNCHVETGEMSQKEFNEKWEITRKQNRARIADIDHENYQIRQILKTKN